MQLKRRIQCNSTYNQTTEEIPQEFRIEGCFCFKDLVNRLEIQIPIHKIGFGM